MDTISPLLPLYETAIRTGDATRMIEALMEDPYAFPGPAYPAAHEQARQLLMANIHLWQALPKVPFVLERRPRDRLSEIRVPTLILVGDRDRPSTRALAHELQGLIARSTVAEIEGAGHLLNMERPTEFNRLVIGFLSGLSDSGVRGTS